MAVDDIRRRNRRRRRRQLTVLGFLLIAFGMAWFFENQATTTVILVRYAEPAADPAGNPGLSEAGKARAEELARLLAYTDVVAGVDAIIATQFRRAQETGDPLARRLHLAVQTADVNDIEGLRKRILKQYKGKIVLVIAHPDQLDLLIREFHGSKKLPPMAAGEFDNVYIVSIPWYGRVKTLRLKYGAPFVPPLPAQSEPTVPAPAAQ